MSYIHLYSFINLVKFIGVAFSTITYLLIFNNVTS
jgi:hypothetical protein